MVGASEPPGANCTYGGVKYVSLSGTNYVCTGALGPTGITGAAGVQGSSGPGVVSANEPSGANCAFGGIKYTSPSGVNYLCGGAPGAVGPRGLVGPAGPQGITGATGALGAAGSIGPAGAAGTTGATGAGGQSVTGSSEAIGTNCPTGGHKYVSSSGTAYVCNGATGPTGSVSTMAYGFFFAIMPGDNSASVAAATAISFPQQGPVNGILRMSGSEFTLPAVGTYEVSWQASISEAGQLVLGLDSGAGVVEQADSVVGRAIGTSQLSNHMLLTTTVTNSILSVRNPAGSPTALTITPIAGGTSSVSASLLIKRIL